MIAADVHNRPQNAGAHGGVRGVIDDVTLRHRGEDERRVTGARGGMSQTVQRPLQAADLRDGRGELSVRRQPIFTCRLLPDFDEALRGGLSAPPVRDAPVIVKGENAEQIGRHPNRLAARALPAADFAPRIPGAEDFCWREISVSTASEAARARSPDGAATVVLSDVPSTFS